MIKTFKKAISLFVATAFILSLVPVVGMAETQSVTIGVQNYGTCHYEKPDNSSIMIAQGGSKTICTARGESSKKAYAYGQFDLSGYEEILENDSTKVTYSVVLGGDYSSSKCSNLTVQLFNDEHDYVDSAITYNEAASLGLHGTGDLVIFSQTSGVEEKGTSSAEVDVEGLVSVLQSGTDNSLVCYAASTKTSAPVYFKPGIEGTGLTIEYDDAEIDNQDYVDTIAANYLWSEVSAQSEDAITENIELPEVYRGASVTWSSSNEDIISNEGVVTPAKDSAEVTLTAELSYSGLSDEASVATADFVLTVAGEEKQSVLLPVSNPKHSRSKNPNTASDPTDQSGTKITIASLGGGDNNRYAYGQFDLTGYESILTNPSTKATYSLYMGAGFSDNRAYNFKVQLFNDESDYDPATITFNVAKDLGLHGDGVATIFERTSTEEARGVTSSAEVSTELLTQVLNSGAGDSIITYAVSTTNSLSTVLAPYAKNTGLTIEYFNSEVDNQAYLENLVNNLTWADLSADSAGAVAAKLPTLYGGASIVWSADESGVVTPDGVIKASPDAKDVTLTADFTYNGVAGSEATASATFDVTIAPEAGVTVQIPFTNYGNTRSDKTNAQKYQVNSSNSSIHYVGTGGIWDAYAQLDLSGYEEILANPSTTVDFKIKAGNGFTSYAYDFKVYLADNSVDSLDNQTLTYQQAVAMNLFDTERPVLFERTDTAAVSNGTIVEGVAGKDNLLSVLGDGIDGLVTLYIQGASGSAFRINDAATGLFITYYESEIDDAAYLEDIESEFTWDNLTSDSAGAVENALPTYFKGADITWASENATVLSSGELVRSREEAIFDKITATVDFNGETFTKSFDITVAQKMPTVISIPVNQASYIDVDYPDSTRGIYSTELGLYQQYRIAVGPMYGSSDDRHGYFKYDLSDYKEILDAATKFTFKIVNKDGKFSNGCNNSLTVLNNVNNSWTQGHVKENDVVVNSSGLTYNMAVETGMYTDPGTASVKGVVIQKTMEISTPELLEGVKEAVAQNPETGMVTFRLTGEKWHGSSYRGTYTVEIEYYPEDVKTEADYVSEKTVSMPWRAITNQDADSVLADLDLPQSFYGKTITWASSDEAVIKSSGEVIQAAEDKQVKLTATVDGAYTKEFDVTVPAKNFVVKNSTAKENGSTAYLNYTNTYIYANKDAGTIPSLIIATYSNGKLEEITIKENYEIKKGENYIISGYHYGSRNSEVKVFFMNTLETVAPMYDVNNK